MLALSCCSWLVAAGVLAGGVSRAAVSAGPVMAARGEAGGGLAAAAPGFRGEPGGGAARVFFLPGVPGVQDPLVADDEQAGVNSMRGARPMRRHQPRLMSLVAGSLAVAKPRSAPVRRA